MDLPTFSVRASGDGPYGCPCCGYLTLEWRGYHQICHVCFWQDDGQDDHDADEEYGGANGRLSLTEARRNFARWGACEASAVGRVRAPRDDEHPLSRR
ncbi:CPCC family cysteine-rich protein [Catellatospora vulcania]|uniref:CPCC family cysteine-rich protein n=1 Tax=Catellatospora vulcania TaxID=1460450 RepID=UPI001E464FBB|nr:CPCC family cysteine-rich protein [Catellatospora vulcania]